MSKIKFDFKPDDKTLNPHYIKLEKCINDMNASSNRDEIEKLCGLAIKEVLAIRRFNLTVIDMMGGGLS